MIRRWTARLRPASLRARVAWIVLALLTSVLVVLFVVVDLALSDRLHDDARTRLTDRVGLAQQLDGQLSAEQLVDRLGGDGVTVQLCRTDGSGCATTVPNPAPPRPGAGDPRGPRPKPVRANADVPVETAGSVLFVRTQLNGAQVLTLSLDTTQITEALARLVVLQIIGGAVALLLAGLAAARLSRTALRPLEQMTTLARQIAAGDRGRRLGTAGPDSELRRMAAAFDAMLDELEAAETRMRTFLADASHELRTPMAGLQANAELLLRENPDRAERERVAVALVRESRRAARLVDDLLTMTRAGEGIDLAQERLDLIEIARTETARAQALAPALTFLVEGDEQCPVVGDPLRLGQILGNLLDNARHATPAGGSVTVTAERRDGRAVLTVGDTGPGVPPGERDVIFERFGRGDASRSRNTGGAGLGLPIARGLARAHGGDLTYVDRPAGACFRLDLPAAAAPASSHPGPAPTDNGSMQRPRGSPGGRR
ncbi:HAMP domain-containing sensor histidine kinase [Paractinoplanes ferrugineus]|uniref:histidine kinase n=1 Tax=Paractinoplanes ferrugineus TaxID=113564 RepID=A0A919MEW0_9ACTN|nr:HAMP domain-containing sensor histidine kinase [Actinoplanes ferrugineus]GIE13173.1 two-component sensor histidine kinase [Actinoplanes ferrugineus]